MACTAQALPSGSLKNTNWPQGNCWTSLTSTPRPASSACAAWMWGTTICMPLIEAGAEGDGAGRTGWREPHEAHLVADRVVVVQVKANLVNVEILGAVHVRDGDVHQFELPIHARTSFGRVRSGR